MGLKQILKKALRFLMTPVRKTYHKRNGGHCQVPRKEIPNRVLLGLARDMIREGHSATIAVKGYSMRPFLEHERDCVVLEPANELKVGDAVLAEIEPDHYVLHRIIKIEGDSLTLMGDGNVKGTESCERKDVAGIVTHYIRPKRTIPASDPALQRRIRLWRQLLPIRRYLLIIYKAIV